MSWPFSWSLIVSEHSQRTSRSTKWVWIISSAAMLGVALVLSFLLSEATNNQRFYEQHYQWLFWVTVGMAGVLTLVIVIALVRLTTRLLRGKFGSRLLLKLAGIFALVGLLPGLVVYTVSYQFVSRSIETWFDVQVEGALDAGLALGQKTLDARVNDLTIKTQRLAEQLAIDPDKQQLLALEGLREQIGIEDLAIVAGNGQVLTQTGAQVLDGLELQRVTTAELKKARSQRSVSSLEGLDDDPTPPADSISGSTSKEPRTSTPARARVLAWIPSTRITLDTTDRYLLAIDPIPAELSHHALAVQDAYREYQQRALAKEGLKRLYVGTLTLTLILAVFGALLLAATLGQQIAKPMLLLAEGVRDVAQGDLSPKPVFTSRDELGGLTRAFADMTQQLSDARLLAQRSLSELDASRSGVQTILDNLTTGVLLIGHKDLILSANPSAARILGSSVDELQHSTLADHDHLLDMASLVQAQFDTLRPGPDELDHWQQMFELKFSPAFTQTHTLLVRGAVMPKDQRLIVFDDITELVSAQRTEAWGEVARRLAHEIKNPLTPIQLSAERLQHKLASKLEVADQALLNKSVNTIVNQVQSMKQLVNEFRDYARLPAAQLKPVDLNQLITEVLQLYGEATDRGQLKAELSVSIPRIQGDATQLRQVIHNLVQNALDAVDGRPESLVSVSTEPMFDENHQPRGVKLCIQDNGPGFADHVLNRAFEPYITTKSKGTGLGLAVVKKIADEHSAKIKLSNWIAPSDGSHASVNTHIAGARVSLSFSKLSSVSDESA